MNKTKRKIPTELKIKIVQEIEDGKSVREASREYGFNETLIHKWKKDYMIYQENAFQGNGHLYKEEARINQLERLVGKLTMENELLKKTIKNLKEKGFITKELNGK